MEQWLTVSWSEFVGIASLVVILASRIARLTPNKTDDKLLVKIEPDKE